MMILFDQSSGFQSTEVVAVESQVRIQCRGCKGTCRSKLASIFDLNLMNESNQ
jgi:hypothetical protein